tara:strand:- start:107 stop:478 length:372 start_codon:yes stop_codon:yes gene_type:complete
LDSFYEDLEIEVMITTMMMTISSMMMMAFHSRRNPEPLLLHVHFLPQALNPEALLVQRVVLLEDLLVQRRAHHADLPEQKAHHADPLEHPQLLPEDLLVQRDHHAALLEAHLVDRNEPLNQQQ